MPIVSANGVEIAYDERGNRGDPAIILIMGLGTQMIAWPDELCDGLSARGFRVVRFDNRDIGLPRKFDDTKPLNPASVLLRALSGTTEMPHTSGARSRAGQASDFHGD